MNDYTTTKIKIETRRLARVLAAHTGKSMIDVLHRLVIEEVKRSGLQQHLIKLRTAVPEEK